MVEYLDTLDKKILFELDHNGRVPYSEIGKKLRKAKTTIKHRIESLMERGIISCFYSLVDYTRVGYSVWRLYVKLENCPPEKEKEMINYLMKEPCIPLLFKINGNFNLVIGIWAKSPWEVRQFWERFRSNFLNQLTSVHLSALTKYVEFTRGYLSDKHIEKKQFIFFKEPDNIPIDEKDLKLLKYISHNGRASLLEISEKTNLSPMIVRHRMKNLIKNRIILGCRPILNYEKLGYQYYKVDLYLSRAEDKKVIEQHILSHPNVLYTQDTVIGSDLEFDMEVKSFEEFLHIMNGFMDKFPKDIRKYDFYAMVKIYKMV